MAQRICQQDRIVSLTFVKSYKDSPGVYRDRTLATCFRRFNSALTPLCGWRPSHVHAVFQLPILSSTTLLLVCGKRCENLTADVHPRTEGSISQSFEARFSTLHQPLPTEFEQSLSRCHLSQRVPAQCDVELTEDNHQKLPLLLSSKTVIKYSSHKERG